jgi:hypothetical protein
MKRMLVMLCLAPWLAPATARAGQIVRPEGVFGELVSASAQGEHARLGEALVRAGAKGSMPELQELTSSLARMVGAPGVDGIDLKRPMAIVLVDPRRGSRPALWAFEVQDEKRFAESMKAAPSVASRRLKKAVVLGGPDAVGLAGDYALSRLKNAPQEGLRGRLFVQPVWSAYGAQANLVKALISGQAQGGAGMPPATMGKIFDSLFSGIEQSEELGLEAGAKAGVFEATLALTARAGTPLDVFVAAQRPSDFSLVGKLAQQDATFLVAGHLEVANAAEGFADWTFGEAADPKTRAQRVEWMRACSGDIALLGTLGKPSQAAYQYLLRGAGAARLLAVFPAMMDAMGKSGLMGMGTMARTSLPSFSYEDLTVSQAEVKYDFSKMPEPAKAGMGEVQFTQRSAWTGWDDLVAMVTGAGGEGRMKKLVDAARRKLDTYRPSGVIEHGLARARANKESVWARVDLGALGAVAPKPIDVRFVPTFGIGFGGHRAWLRFSTAEAR